MTHRLRRNTLFRLTRPYWECGPVDDTAEERYSVVSYQLIYGGLVELVVAELNTDLVDEDLETSEAIRQAFIVHKDNKDLLTDPILFRKI